MDITNKQAVDAISHLLGELNAVDSNGEYSIWSTKASIFLSRIYGEKSIQIQNLKNIDRWHTTTAGADQSQNYINNVSKAKRLLHGFLEEIDLLGLPHKIGMSDH